MATFIPLKQRLAELTPPARRFSLARFLPTGKELIVAAVPLALTCYYLTRVAPALVPLPEGVQPPFPLATRFLESACAWCGKNPERVVGIAGALFLPVILLRVRFPRYFVKLGALTTLALAFTYYSISAPVDRLLKNVQDNLPRREMPDFLPKKP